MKRALIVVDYQRDFVTGSLGFPGAVALAERIAKKIAAYHKSGDVVLFTMDTHTDDYRNTQEGKHLPVPHCIKGTAGHTLVPEVAVQVQPQDLFLKKTRSGQPIYLYICGHSSMQALNWSVWFPVFVCFPMQCFVRPHCQKFQF